MIGVLMLLGGRAAASDCISVTPSRHDWFNGSAVVAKARYAGERTFVVEQILFSLRDQRPATITLPRAEVLDMCSPPDRSPVAGEAYLVARRACTEEPCPVLWGLLSKHRDDLNYIRDRRVMTTRELLEALSALSFCGTSLDDFTALIGVAGSNDERNASMHHMVLDEIEDFLFVAEESSNCTGFDATWFRGGELQNAATAALSALPATETEQQYLAWQEIHDPDGDTPTWQHHVEAVQTALRGVFTRYDASRPCAHLDPQRPST